MEEKPTKKKTEDPVREGKPETVRDHYD